MVAKDDSATEARKPLDVWVKTFIAGGTAGCCAKTTVAPLDRVKILMQGHNKHYKHLGVLSSLHGVTVKEGFLGLYKGNFAQMIRIFPYAAIQFMSFEQYKKFLQSLTHHVHPHLVNLLSGSLAGLSAVFATYPLDVVRARLAFQVTGEHIYFGVIDTFRTIKIEEGRKGFFRGIIPSLLGMAPYAGLSFYTFETLKAFCLSTFPDALGRPCPKTTGGLVLFTPAKLLCGGLAGAVAQTLVYPLDVARRKIQLASMLPEADKYNGKRWWTILYVVYQDHGIRNGLFRGLTVNYLRVMPMTAVSFTVYETTKQLFGLDTGVTR